MNHQRVCLVLLVFLLLNVLTSCSKKTELAKTPSTLNQYIKCAESPVEYHKILFHYGNMDLPIPDFLTKKEALEDIEVFEYLIKTSYAGYEYWKHQGVDFDLYFSELRSFAEQKDTIPIDEFEKEWSEILSLISDGHIGLQGKNAYGAYKHLTVYFCDIVVAETEQETYKVINSQFEPVKTGDYFTQNDVSNYLFKTLSPAGENHYLIGVFSYQPITSQKLSFNNKPIEIQFHENRLGFVKNNQSRPFNIRKVNNIAIVNVSSFANEIYPIMKQFMESGHQLKDEKYIIANVMNNGGGSSLFPQTFISNLNGKVYWDTHWGELSSPPIIEYYAGYDLESKAAQSPGFRQMIEKNRRLVKSYQIAPKKKWVCSKNGEPTKTGEDFKGKLLVLANRNVLSAGEAFVGVSACVKNRILIGENTGGSGMFSSACDYYLPNSKFIAKIPRHFILIPDFEECRGFLPDYWINTTEPVKEISDWLLNNQSYQFTYKSSFNQFLENRAKTSDLVFPENMTINPPPEAIPKELAKFSGSWFGVADGILNTAIVVEEIYNKHEAKAIYAWGVAPRWNINKAGWQRFSGKFQHGNLVLSDETKTQIITLKIMPNGKMEECYQRPGIYSKVILTKIEE